MFDKEFVLEYFRKLKARVREEKIEKRDLKVEPLKNKAVVIAGPRRAGKTYYLLNILKKNGDNAIYIDLEHSAFEEITHKDIFEIVSLFQEYFDLKVDLILLDEIQKVNEWERLVRSLVDSGFEVIVSGSSSKLLSREIATQLRGRGLTYLLLPLSFREYLRFHGIEVRDLLSLSERVKVKRILEDYLEWGAYPEIVKEWEKREKILREYFDTILQKDFIERFKIAHVDIAKFIFEFIFQNFSKELSVHKISNWVNAKIGRNVKNRVYEYTEKLPETMAVFFLEKFSKSVYQRKSWPRKVYICDVGLANLLRFEKDYGKRMENVVFLELLRKTNEKPMLEIFYWRDYQQHEVDFVVKEGLKVKQLIQVTYASGKDEIEVREIKALLKASDLLKCKDLLCITWDFEGEEEIKGKRIKFVPLWRWLLKISFI